MGKRIYPIVLCLFMAFVLAVPAHASATLEEAVQTLATGKLKERATQIDQLASFQDVRVVPVLEALGAGTLFYRKSDKAVFRTAPTRDGLQLIAPLTGSIVATEAQKNLRKIKVNNKLRRQLKAVIADLTLASPDEGMRLQAVNALAKAGNHNALPDLKAALAKEQHEAIKTALSDAIAALTLKDPEATEEEKLSALILLKEKGNQQALAIISAFAAHASSPQEQAAAQSALASVEKTLVFWEAGQNIWYGLSLGSVLLLAAIGLAITFGVMGVINMAHGEMVMIGAYTTFVVQDLIRTSFPGAFEYSLAIALPAAFLVSSAVGFALERSVIRFLYGRPLETLLATWGVSLMLQQAIRSIFGPINQEVGNPDWMSGAFELGGLTLTANRFWILVFALFVFAVLLVVLKRTHFGLQMRAVTQNRGMAASMGIRTPWVDAFTFALGSGIAGIAGVALSQISNVSPNLGQLYIIDSFMVVVFGGVGNLWGTLVGAMSLGVANKFLEPYSGAVLAKILTLTAIILFIQKKPRGLFALKGRAVEA
ncbi:urea ABC transporter permease subunit UrtB [Pseudovibrio sp. FO-BEG1]|uniref:urea ABC transporter permease subunit UrtB n=1 Tax=Pseudovibrio sp. (strain FO-BEG1) TaxID=911045 RepID=UPI00031835DB|nr:urea ABC transporter permease subunit UrtB [Pseudovibrio sp. FO-BEG1]